MRGTRPQPSRTLASRRNPSDRSEATAQRRSNPDVPRAGHAEIELQAILESVDNAVLLFDLAGHLRSMNLRFAQWMDVEGVSRAQLNSFDSLARRLAPLFSEPDRFLKRWQDIQHGEEAVWDELRQMKPEQRILERFSRPVFDAQGARCGRLEIYRDITGERLIHSKLLQTEKMAALGQLVSGIAHELNNPLTGIMGYAQLLLARQNQTEPATDAHRIFEEAQRAHRIVKNLLLFSRETKPVREPVQLNEIVERTLALRSYELKVKNIAVRLELKPGLPCIVGDAHQLQQVVLNLLINAEQAVEASATRGNRGPQSPGPSAGQIGIRTRLKPASGASEQRITLEVADTGPGISPDTASRIFDPFFTTKPIGVGTGLGLSIVYGIVHEHGGEVSVGATEPAWQEKSPSGPPWRTVFTVELPFTEAAPSTATPTSVAAAAAAATKPVGASKKNRRVLIIEDEPTVAKLVSDVLRQEGIHSDTAVGGQKGLYLLLSGSPQGGTAYDLLICDLKMPGLDGAALYAELVRRNHPAKNRILFITGDTLSRRTLDFLERHKVPFLAKPFLADELRMAVQRRLQAIDAVREAERESP